MDLSITTVKRSFLMIYDSASDFWGDLAANFHEGLARVVKNNRFGFINSKGNEVIPCQYDFAHDFKNGSAVVQSNKFGVINTAGEFIYPLDIDDVTFEDDIYIIGRKGEYFGVIDRNGNEVSPFANTYFDIATVIYPPIDDFKTIDDTW